MAMVSSTSLDNIPYSSPSPSTEEGDITHARPWLANDDSAETGDVHHPKWKGKERALDSQYDNATSNHSDSPPPSAYPPENEEEAETRRIQENLRQWEIAERQRRKAARESSQSSPLSPSLVEDVARRASSLWTGRKAKHSSGSGFGLGTHRPLQSEDNNDNVPLTDIIASPTPSPTRTNSDRSLSQSPFADPPDSSSPFSDSHKVDTENTNKDPPQKLSENEAVPLNQSGLLSPHPVTNNYSRRQPPPPKPLGLPQPRAPPPPVITPHDDNESVDVDERPDKWWHEWLCGCGEGADRGGDNQAGRTNPFE